MISQYDIAQHWFLDYALLG